MSLTASIQPDLSHPGQIIVLSGPSGVGKGTICQRLLSETASQQRVNGQPRLVLSVSVTSRPPRAGETEGVSYSFTSRSQFEALIESDSFLEWAEYNGHYYGTPKAGILALLAQGTSVLLEIEVQGALQVKANYPAAQLIFIAPPADSSGNSLNVLRDRLLSRGNTSSAEIERRLTISAHELTQQHLFDHVLINDTLDSCCKQLMFCLNLYSFLQH